MPKGILKERKREKQNGRSALSGRLLPKNDAEIDTHRDVPKAEGGGYDDPNYGVVLPKEHMIEHGTLRLRTAALDDLKAAWDSRVQVMKFRNKVSNQLLAFTRRTDYENEDVSSFLTGQLEVAEVELTIRDKHVTEIVEHMAEDNLLMKATFGIDGVGAVTVAGMTVYVDLTKARYPSSLWSYVGYDKASYERYEKGVAGGGNKTLRTILYTSMDSQMKTRGAYRDVYDRTKERLAVSHKLVMSRNTQGKLVEVMWKDTMPCHRHGAALRMMGKYFLADYWFVGRTLMGLPTADLYVKEHLGHASGIINPRQRGWEW